MINDLEQIFEHELSTFRTEVDSGIQFFFAYWAINTIIGRDKKAHEKVNRSPLFWLTMVGGLHTSFFIVLGRIFDQKSKHNIDRLIASAQNNMNIFSKSLLGDRKRREGLSSYDTDNFIKTAYEPSVTDFRRIRKHIKKYRQIYESNYKAIRHKILAHKELSDAKAIHDLYTKTNVRELAKIFIFLNKVHETLWELLHNGRKPILRPMRFSAQCMLEKRCPEGWLRPIQEMIVNDTQDFFNLLTCKRKLPH